MTNCQQNKQSLDRLEIYPPIFFGNQGRVYHSKLKNAGHTYGAVYYGKLEFTIVNFL